jgi:predicted O-methyltransferase YrrM
MTEQSAASLPVRAIHTIADAIAAAVVFLTLPILKMIARHEFRHSAKLCRKVTDRAGFAIVRKHYYTPLVFAADIKHDLSAERVLKGVDLNESVQLELLGKLRFQDELLKFPMQKQGELQYFYDNGFYETGDAEYLYSIIRHFKPRKVIEIGSGFSTLIAAAALKKNLEEDAGLAPEHISIEPFERPWLEKLGSRVIRSLVEECDLQIFSALEANDILFIDSSHVVRPQGDVLFELQTIVPLLKPGVLVHVHDIFTPRDYPYRWVVEQRRLWSEQYLVEAFLAFNSAFEVIGALNWLKHNHHDAFQHACPVIARRPQQEPGAFWFRRKSN